MVNPGCPRACRAALLWCTAAGLLGAALPARAAPEEGEAAKADAPARKKKPKKTAEQSQREEEAFALFEESELRYREGRFEEAAELLEKAYGLDPEPTLLFNRGRALESAGNLEGAVEAYSAYLDAAPDAEDRVQIDRRVQTLWRQIKEKQELERARDDEARKRAALEAAARERSGSGTVAVTEPQDPASGRPARGGRVLPWVVIGAGAAGLAAGGVFGFLASTAQNDALDQPEHRAASERADDARSLATGANIAYVAGGVLAVAGVVLYVLDPGGASSAPPAKLTVGPGSISLSGAF